MVDFSSLNKRLTVYLVKVTILMQVPMHLTTISLYIHRDTEISVYYRFQLQLSSLPWRYQLVFYENHGNSFF